MTTDVRRGSQIDSFQMSEFFWPVVVATVGITTIVSSTSLPDWVAATTIVAVIAVLGIPHGSVDHLVVEAIDARHDLRSRRRFMVAYVLAMAVVGLVWLVVPPLALVGFLALSVHHFGQSDLAYLHLTGLSHLAVQWSRGLFLVGLPLVAHIPAIAPVVERLGGGDLVNWPWLADLWWFWVAVLVIQHVVVGVSIASRIRNRAVIGREMVTVAALTLLFLTADPLIGFAVYFGLWHSLAHLRVLSDLLGSEMRPMRSLARLAAPLTALSLAALAAAGIGAALAGRLDLFVPATFVLVSMLTLPHMIVVERLWRRCPSPE
jgi:Brp/Blh family beta-carotene 15,15'-monooxygenase